MGRILNVSLSADGRLLASGGEDSTLKIWDMQTGECLKTLEGHQGWLAALAFIPASQTLGASYCLASAGSDRLRSYRKKACQWQ